MRWEEPQEGWTSLRRQKGREAMREREEGGWRERGVQSELEKGREVKKWKQGPQKTFREFVGKRSKETR